MYLGVLVGLINRLFLLPHYLTLEQLGLIDAITIIAVVYSELALVGLKGSLQKFFSIFESNKTLPNYIGLTLVFSFIGFIILGIPLYLFKNSLIDLFPRDKSFVNEYYFFIYPLALFIMYKGVFTIFSINKMRLTVPSIINEFYLKIAVLIILLLKGLGLIDFDWYVILFCISYAIGFILLYSYCKKVLSLKIKFNLNPILNSHSSELKKYSFFVLLMGISNTVSQYTDSIMLASVKGLETSAIYSVAFFIGLSIEMPKRAISNISGAIIARHWNEGNQNEIIKLYKQSSINQGIIGIGLFLIILFSIDEIFYILPKSEILSQGKNVAIIIALSRVIDMLTGINNEILRTSPSYRLDFYLIIFFIVISVISNYILIPLHGLEGAAFATLISVSLYNTIRYILLYKLYNFNPFTYKTLWLIFIFILLSLVIYLTPNIAYNNIIFALLIIGVKTLAIGCLFTFITYKLKLSNEINNLLNWGFQILRKKRL